jgi:enoyl-CoA hydratase/carnithine racemase
MADDMGRVKAHADGHLLHICFDRPAKLNAFTPEMMAELAQAYDRLEAEDELRCGVLYAEGTSFTAGLELTRFAPLMRESKSLHPAGSIDPFGLTPPFRAKPVVFAVHGWCLTLGIELMLGADIVVAAADTRFRQHEVARAVMPTGGATLRMVSRAGFGNAMRYLLTGDEFSADEALRLGFVQEVVAPGAERARAIEIAALIAEQAPLAVQATRTNAVKAVMEGHPAAIAEFTSTQQRLAASEDAAEGLAAFVERRTGNFTGR